MKDKILITGFNGALSKSTSILLKKHNFDVIYYTTDKNQVDNKTIFFWNPVSGKLDLRALDQCSHIIHLSGLSIMKRWTKKNKLLMYSSRVLSSELLFKTCMKNNIKIKTFISASAIGFYGLQAHGIQVEADPPGQDWISNMTLDWEKSAKQFKALGARVIQMRISLLLDKSSGYLKSILRLMKYGCAPVFGSGNNNFEWIHIDDAARFIIWSIKNKFVDGPYNLASKIKITQIELINFIKKRYAKYSLTICFSSFFLSCFLGSKSKILEGGVSVSVDKLKSTGFKWKHESLDSIIDFE